MPLILEGVRPEEWGGKPKPEKGKETRVNTEDRSPRPAESDAS